MGVNMNRETEPKNIIHLNSDGKKGDVQIADEVIAVIAGLAATEVKGVSKSKNKELNKAVEKKFDKDKIDKLKLIIGIVAYAITFAQVIISGEHGHGGTISTLVFIAIY